MKAYFQRTGFHLFLFLGASSAALAAVLWLHLAYNLVSVELAPYDQEKHRVLSRAGDVEELLLEQGIEKEPGDRAFPSLHHPLEEGMEVRVRQPLPWEEAAYEEGFRYTSFVASLSEVLKARAVGNETGTASWYGSLFHGQRTTSGEIFDKEAYTAAHREVPLGTWVEVTFLRTGRSVLVRINDRGPFIGDRIIDLSKRAAREIGLLPYGIGRVRVEVVGVERYYPFTLEYISSMINEEFAGQNKEKPPPEEFQNR